MIQDLVVYAAYIAYAIAVLMGFGIILTWVERKQSAVMSDRIGANRAYIRLPFTQVKLVWLGLFHGMADGIKMLLKEDFKPITYDWYAYMVAPWVAFTPVLLVFAVIPFGGVFIPSQIFGGAVGEWFAGKSYPMQIAQLDAGLLIVFAFSGLTIIGAMLAGWSSSNKFSLLGALRAGSQMISYELILGLTVLGLVLIYGTLDLTSIVQQQSGTVLGFLPAWGIVLQPFAATLFLAAAIAENKRIPFDLPEAESELIAGYFTEYSAMKMGLFMFAEFIEIAIVAALFTTLFLGGYNLPWMTNAGFVFPWGAEIALSHGVVVLIQMITFLAKVFLVCSFQILIRWSLPRFRYDQVLMFAWKFMFPLALANMMVTAVAVWLIREREAGSRDAEPTMRPRVPPQAVLERARDGHVGEALPAGDPARPVHHQPRVPAQHGEVDDGQERRAHHVLPGGAPRRLLADQPRQAHPDAARRRVRQTAVHRLQHVRDGVPGQGHRDRGGIRPVRPGAPEGPGPLRDRLLALHLLRAVRRSVPRGRDPDGQGHARPAFARPHGHVDRQGGTPELEAAERRGEEVPEGGGPFGGRTLMRDFDARPPEGEIEPSRRVRA